MVLRVKYYFAKLHYVIDIYNGDAKGIL